MINLGPTSDGSGNVYVTTSGNGCRLHALDRDTGATRWCSESLDRLVVASSPLIDREGHLYIADGRAMHSFTSAGTLRWKVPIIGVPMSAQFTRDGAILFITHVGIIYLLDRMNGSAVAPPFALVEDASFDPADGAMACMRGLPACPSANMPVVDLATGRFYFTFWTPGAAAAGVRAMRLTGGASPAFEELWRNDSLAGGSASSPVLSADGSRLYLTDNEGSVHALDASSGSLIWSLSIGYASGGSLSLSPEGLIMPAGGSKASLMAIADRGDRGEILWKRDDLRNFGIATQARGFRAYPTVARERGKADLLIVDTRTGDVLDRDPLPGTPIFTVGTTIDDDGTVYVPTIGGELHAFRPGPALDEAGGTRPSERTGPPRRGMSG